MCNLCGASLFALCISCTVPVPCEDHPDALDYCREILGEFASELRLSKDEVVCALEGCDFPLTNRYQCYALEEVLANGIDPDHRCIYDWPGLETAADSSSGSLSVTSGSSTGDLTLTGSSTGWADETQTVTGSSVTTSGDTESSASGSSSTSTNSESGANTETDASNDTGSTAGDQTTSTDASEGDTQAGDEQTETTTEEGDNSGDDSTMGESSGSGSTTSDSNDDESTTALDEDEDSGELGEVGDEETDTTGDDPPCTDVTSGCACDVEFDLACQNQKVTLICQDERWTVHDTCASTENCNRDSGTCETIVEGCSGQSPGHVFCEQGDTPGVIDVRRECGPDLVTTTDQMCDGVCRNGNCQTPACGDGKIQAGEECDDSNSVKLDGCEPDLCVHSGIEKVVLGARHSCVLLRPGYVKCWGDNRAGQLGLGNTNDVSDRHPREILDKAGGSVVRLPGLASSLAAGWSHTCAIVEKELFCWGDNQVGQLGYGHSMDVADTLPADLGPLTLDGPAFKVWSNVSVTCVLLEDQLTLRCFGDNTAGMLGLGHSEQPSLTLVPADYGPIEFPTASRIRSLALGLMCNCVLFENGDVQCWGRGRDGCTGLGTAETPRTDTIGDDELLTHANAGLVPLASGIEPVEIHGRGDFNCVRSSNGDVQCWGSNQSGQLGLGHGNDIGDNESPAGFGKLGGPKFQKIRTGNAFTCGMSVANKFLCWGANSSAQLAYPDMMVRGRTQELRPHLLEPVQIDLARSISDFDLGFSHACLVYDSQDIVCWGSHQYGQAGLPNAANPVGGKEGQTPDVLPSVSIFHN